MSIEEILDDIVESYRTDETINNLKTCALPNRRQVIEAFHHLQHIVFLGFFTDRDVRCESLKLNLGEHLLSAYDILTTQMKRAVAWNCYDLEDGKNKECETKITLFLKEIPKVRSFLAEDVNAAFRNDPAALSIEDIVFSYPCIVAITAYRVAHELHKLGVPMIPRIISEYAHSKTGIDIHPAAEIGRKFFIDHGTGVVIGATTQIGEGVVLYQGVTLGALHVDPDADPSLQRHPTIEDSVTIYAGSTILGGNTVIGKHSTIGGNVWLIHSVPPYSRVYNTSAKSEVRVDEKKKEINEG